MFGTLSEISVGTPKSIKAAGCRVIRGKGSSYGFAAKDFQAVLRGPMDVAELMSVASVSEGDDSVKITFDYKANAARTFTDVAFVVENLEVPKDQLNRKLGNGISLGADDTLQIEFLIEDISDN